MKNELHAALRISAKGSGWTVKWDILSKRLDDWVLAVHPHRRVKGIIDFYAKPLAWDHMLWSILQIKGNETKPASFYFTGAFTCGVPAVIQEYIEASSTCEEIAQQMTNLGKRCLQAPHDWQDYDLYQAIAVERPERAYHYHMTRVVERICARDRQAAHMICEAALGGHLDIRYSFTSWDKLAPLLVEGRRQDLSFFELAKIWMSRN